MDPGTWPRMERAWARARTRSAVRIHPLHPPLVPQILEPRLDPPCVLQLWIPTSGQTIHGSQPPWPMQMLPHGGVRRWPLRGTRPARTYANVRHGQTCALCQRRSLVRRGQSRSLVRSCQSRSLVSSLVRRCLVRPPPPLSPTRNGARSPGSGSHMDGQHGHPLQPPRIGRPMGGWHGSRVGGIGMATAVTKPLPGTAWSPPRSNPWR